MFEYPACGSAIGGVHDADQTVSAAMQENPVRLWSLRFLTRDRHLLPPILPAVIKQSPSAARRRASQPV